jgi:precorrin-2/cobalt-factor-2 C20-methyltransferase
MKRGTLYGIGIGPGDPELITLKAIKILNQVSIVFSASSTKNSYSLANNIASVHLKKGMPVEHLGFPMTKDREMLKAAWRKNADRVMEVLKNGKDAAFITLGDPMIYSTFGYIMQTVGELAPDIHIRVIPGITSYQAAAATSKRILAESEESFVVISGALGAEKLKEVSDSADNIVMLKVYHKYKEILSELDRLGLAEKSILVSKCGLEDEKTVSDLMVNEASPHPHYLSLLLIKNQG